MENVFNLAKYFIKTNKDIQKSVFDSNMKLQKLITFAYFINLALYDTELFKDDILAYDYGCVVNTVRQEFKNSFSDLLDKSKKFSYIFDEKTNYVLTLTNQIYGNCNARELSEMQHEFDFWKETNKKNNSEKIPVELIRKEIGKIKEVVDCYIDNSNRNDSYEEINGVKFFYDPEEVTIDDGLLKDLYDMSLTADEKAYSIVNYDGEIVIY